MIFKFCPNCGTKDSVQKQNETDEETGVKLKNPKFFNLYKNEYIPDAISTCNLLFVVTKREGKFVSQDDVEALEWKPIEIVNSDQFAWMYTGFVEDLYAYIEQNHL